mgnify:CR=1 FL=1
MVNRRKDGSKRYGWIGARVVNQFPKPSSEPTFITPGFQDNATHLGPRCVIDPGLIERSALLPLTIETVAVCRQIRDALQSISIAIPIPTQSASFAPQTQQFVHEPRTPAQSRSYRIVKMLKWRFQQNCKCQSFTIDSFSSRITARCHVPKATVRPQTPS